MADITVDSTAASTTTKGKFLWGPYWADDSVGAILAISGSDDPAIYRTTNGGSSWTETALDVTTVVTMAAWYDAETPGLTTKLLHMVWPDIDNDTFDYLNLNLETGVYSNSGTPYTVVATSISFGNSECFVTRTRNGNLIAGMYESVSATNVLYRSTDTGVNWTSRTTVYESTSEDECLGVTVNTGDGADAGVVYWDHSADEISIKVYDDSANAWNETSVSGSMVHPTIGTYRNFSVGTFRSNGKAFLAAFTNLDGTTPDLNTWLLDITSVTAGAAGVTAKTDVLTTTNEAACPAVFIDPRTDAVYVNYLSGSAFTATVNPFYKVSTDAGGTWGSAVALSDATEDDYRALSAGGTCFTNGGKNMPAWYDDDDRDIFTSLFADVVLTSDVLVDGDANGQTDGYAGICGPYWVSPTTGVVIFSNSASDVQARKTTDGGATWGAAATAEAGTVHNISAWFDQSTPGNTGDLVHVVWIDNTALDVTYANFDISAGTWSTPVDIITTFTSSGAQVSAVTRTRNGNLIAAMVGASAGNAAWKSTDVGATWTPITGPNESTAGDFILGATCNTGDDADAAMLFLDTSGDQLSIKVYDDSAGTWNETAISAGGAVSDFAGLPFLMFNAATRLSDGHCIVAAWSAIDSAAADLLTWDVYANTVTAGAASVTAKTDVVTNSPESLCVAVFVDQSNDDLYVAYQVGSAAFDLVATVYRKSTDDGTSWSASAQTYSQQVNDDFRVVANTAMGLASGGGRFEPLWYDDDDLDIFVNYNNSVSIAATGGGGDPEGSLLHSKLLNGGFLVNRGVLVG